jgi:hypothetical protein
MTVGMRPVPPGYLLWLTAGFAVWCSALVVIYAVHAIGCAFTWSVGPLRLGLALVLFAHLAAIGWMWRRLGASDPALDFGRTGEFLRTAVIWATICAFATTFITLSATLLLTVCV